jgi:hypothetical protein
VVICSQLPDNDNTSVTNKAEYLAAEVEGAKEKLAALLRSRLRREPSR